MEYLKTQDFDYNSIIQTSALKVLAEVKAVVRGQDDDLEKMGDIKKIFSKYGIIVVKGHSL